LAIREDLGLRLEWAVRSRQVGDPGFLKLVNENESLVLGWCVGEVCESLDLPCWQSVEIIADVSL
jgi:hypothetical protein